MFKIQHNVETGIVEELPLTEDDIARKEAQSLEATRLRSEREGKEQAKLLLFEKLGITEEEAKLLLG